MKHTSKSKIKVTPLGDRVLVRPHSEKEKQKTASGIYIPETIEKERPEEGEIVAVGEGRYEDGKIIPLRVKVGDTVMFSKYGYEEVKIEDTAYLILKEDSILAIIK